MSEDEFYKTAEVVKLETLSDVNDIGKPWRYEEDGLTVTRTSPWSPPGCHPVGCGLKLYVDGEGKLVRVEGDENNPVTQGRLCPRCIALKDYVYNPARLLHPMKRDPKDRGNAEAWEQITWDEAFDIIKREYDRITAQYGRESIVVFAGTGREGGTFAPYGTMCFGTPNYCYTQSGYACYTPRLAAIAYIAGTTYPEWDYAGALPGRWDDPRYQQTEVLVVWGKAPLESNPDGFFGHAVVDAMRRGTRLIVIDPRVTWLASRADIFLQLRAGTDTALGMAMLDVIIKEDLYDHDFVEYWCYGFDQLAERVRHHAGREGRRDLRRAGRQDPRRGPHVRLRQARCHPVGPRCRPEDRRHAAGPGDGGPHGHHRQSGRPRRADPSRHGRRPQRVRLRLREGRRRRTAEEDDRPRPVPGVLHGHSERARRPHAQGAGNGRALSHQDGLLCRQQPDELHVHGAEALA